MIQYTQPLNGGFRCRFYKSGSQSVKVDQLSPQLPRTDAELEMLAGFCLTDLVEAALRGENGDMSVKTRI